jgi:hypothetical protein
MAKRNKIIYWVSTGLLAFGMLGNGLAQIFHTKGFVSGAVFSHFAADSVTKIFPSLILLILTVVSWYFRPADRKIISVNE